MIVLFNDNTWKYLRNRDYVKDSEIYTRCWDTTKLFPYRNVVKLADLPRSVDIELVDSLKCYHYPYKAAIRSKFGMRRRRKHQGVDLPLKTSDPIYATFNGKVRISIPSSKSGGYGNLIVIRHDNGLETFYGHLSERIVHADEWVEAGQIIGYGGSKVQLRPREFKLIELLLRNAGKIIPRDVILERVWGIESDITENNLDVHIGALRRKLKEIKGETLIKTIRGVGYLAEADDNVR